MKVRQLRKRKPRGRRVPALAWVDLFGSPTLAPSRAFIVAARQVYAAMVRVTPA